MRVNERMKKVFSILLCLCMVAQYVPITAFAVTTAEDGLCEHHPVHTAECGYVAAVAGALCTHVHDEACGCVAGVAGSDCTHAHDDTCGYVAAVEAHECHFECAACANAFPSGEGGTATAVTDEGETTPVTTETTEPPTEATEPAPVCTCESEDISAHAPFCALYVQPENPVCYCVEKCGEESVNEYCDVCYFDATLCAATGEEEQRTFDHVIIESYDPENWMEFVLAFTSAKPGDEIVFKGSQSCDAILTIQEGVTFRGGDWTFTGAFTNNGNIASGTFTNSVTNNATISGGTFTSQVTNNATISGGTFNNSVTNNSNATISGGTFNNKVTQNGIITGGTFAYKESAFRNNGAIEGGTFNGEVQNSSNGYYADIYISGGTFHAKVTNNGTIYGGTFRAEVVNNYRLYGGVINASITCGSDGVIYNLKNDSYQFELGASASLNNSGNRPIYCDDHIAIEYSCELRVDCFFCEETCPMLPHTFGDDYICTVCEWPCSHERNWWSNGVCTKCQKGCDHASGYSSGTGQCNTCDLYCPHTTMGTNGCAVCGVKAAARVNNVLYLSLKEALAAAKSGDTVTAMADYTITEVPDNGLNSFMIPEGVTFDGASYTITTASTGPAHSVTCLNKGTIIGGSFKMMVINNDGGTIRNGIFHKEVKNNGTVYGGTYYQKLTNTYKVVNLASENSRFVFGENAAFEAQSPVSDAMQCDQHVVAGNVADSGSFACNATIKCILCDVQYGTAYHSVDESGKNCKSCGKALQARIGQMGYENLTEAIALAKSGDTVTALADYTGKAFTIPSGVTLSGGGYSFKSSGTGDYFCLDGGVIKNGVFETDVHVKSGTINDGYFDAGVTIDENGSVIINYGVFRAESQTLVIPASTVVNGGSFYGKVTNYGKIYRGNFDKEVTNQTAGTIYGGSFHNNVYNSGAIYGGIFHDYVGNAGTIYDGNFESDTQLSVTNSTNGTIFGGYFESELINHGYIKNLSGDPYHFTIDSGFTFNNQQPKKITCENHMAFDEVCEKQYTCIFCNTQYTSDFHSYNDGGKCTVCDNIASTAVNLRTYYPTLEKALREATSGDSVWHYADRASTITTAITVPAGVTLKSIGDIVFTNAVTNNGTISFQYGATGSYTFKGEVINNGEISSGDTSYSINFNGKVTNHGTISHGSFFEVINYGKISNGSFSVVTNEGTITGGMFSGTVINNGAITGGRFISGTVSNNGVITGGSFWCTVTNNGDISGGSFSKTVTNNARIYNGSFTLDVEHNSGGTIYGGTFSKDIKGSGTIRNIAGDGYTLKLNSGVSCTGPIYCNDHFGGTATCTAQKTCTLCKAGYGNTGEHSMIYAADEDADTITCRCQHCESQTVVFTLDIPDDAVYGSGKLPAAITTGSYSGTMPVVTFKQGETVVEEPVNAGRYTVTMAWGDKSVSGTFFIEPKSLTADAVTITLSKNSYVYNGQEQTPDVTVTVGETVLTPDIDYRVVVPADVVNVGKKTLNVLFLNNYTSSKTATYEIVKATPVLSWDDQTIVYNGNPAEVIAPTVTLANGENFTGSIQYTYGDLDAPPVDAGTYTVTASVPAQDNYNAAEITVQLVIQKATAPEIQWPTATELTYGQKLSESALSSEDANGTFMWKDGNAVPTVTNSGYTVVYTPKDSANYDYSNVVLEKIIPLTVSKADPAYNVPTGLNAIYGQTLADVILPEGWAWEDTSLLVGDVGERDFSANYNPDPENYNAKAAKLTVAVSPKDITDAIIGSFAPMTYNGQAQTPEATVTIDGMTVTGTWRDVTNVGDKSVFTANGNFAGSLEADPGMAKKDISGATITLGERLTYNGEEQTQTVAGVKVDDLDVTFDVSGNRQTNTGDYVLTVTANGNFQGTIATDWSVAKVKLTVTAEDSTVTYGAEDPDEFGWTVTSGTVVDGEELAISISREEGRNAGDYPINIGQSEGDNANYDITFVNGTFTITKAPLLISVIDTSITYGGATPTFDVDGRGFRFQDTLLNLGQENVRFTCGYEQFDDVGTYTVTTSGWESDNYEITYVPGTLTVTPTWLEIIVDSAEKTYGEADPELTYRVDGLLGNDTIGNVMSGKLSRAEGEDVGNYTIVQGSLTTNDNYTVSRFYDADLTINAKAITDADVNLNGLLTYNGKEQTQPITVTAGITYEVTGNKGTNAGDYELTVKGTGNYTGSVTEKWSIAKATVTITAEDKVIYVGAGLPNLTYSVSGLLTGDELVKVPTLNTNANASIAGSYTITVANADAGDNYEISYVGGTLTVMNAETEVETKIEQTELTEVPDGLKDTEFNTIEAITKELISRILAVTTGYAEKDMVHYDVTLQFSLDDGETWIHATEENFPTEGITVILPYPQGTNARDYEFVVSHMFTVTTQRLGTVAGDVELPKVEETANGIRVTLNGLSPVTVAARYHDHTGGTATCTEKAVCTICGNAYGEVDKTNHADGTEVKDTKEVTCGANGYTGDTYCKGCGEIVEKGATIEATGEHTYGDWKVVKEPTKTTKGEKQRTCSVCGHVDSKEIPVLSDTPATGDNSDIMLYGSMFTMILAALVVLLLASKKRKQAS